MSIEHDLDALLKTICPRAFAEVAPLGTEKPYLIWQGAGGRTLRYADNTAADKRNTLMQITAWAFSRLEANRLIRQVEDALCASSTLTVVPQGEPLATHEEDTKLFGAIQRFSIYSSR
jgi:hypothetical protein